MNRQELSVIKQGTTTTQRQLKLINKGKPKKEMIYGNQMSWKGWNFWLTTIQDKMTTYKLNRMTTSVECTAQMKKLSQVQKFLKTRSELNDNSQQSQVQEYWIRQKVCQISKNSIKRMFKAKERLSSNAQKRQKHKILSQKSNKNIKKILWTHSAQSYHPTHQQREEALQCTPCFKNN